MESHYLCPHCRGHLKVGDYIVFRVRNRKREKGLLLLHPEVGNYTRIKHPQFEYEEGDKIDFFCPLCLQFLDGYVDENLVQVIMVDVKGHEYEIYFSRIAGENCTYQVSDDGIRSIGEHSSRYSIVKMENALRQYLN